MRAHERHPEAAHGREGTSSKESEKMIKFQITSQKVKQCKKMHRTVSSCNAKVAPINMEDQLCVSEQNILSFGPNRAQMTLKVTQNTPVIWFGQGEEF